MYICANPQVVYQRVPDGAVLFDSAAEVYFGLNPVGARAWELLSDGARSQEAVCEALLREYPDAAPETVQDDIAEWVEELSRHGLVLATSGAGAHASS